MEKQENISEEIVIVGSRYGALSDVLIPLFEKGEPIEQKNIKEKLGGDVVYFSPVPNERDPYAVGVFTLSERRIGHVWMHQAPALREWLEERKRRYVSGRITMINAKYGLMIALLDSPVKLDLKGRKGLAMDYDWAKNLPEVLSSITAQSLGLSIALLQDELSETKEWNGHLQKRIDNLLRNLPLDLSAQYSEDSYRLYHLMKQSPIDEVRQQSFVVLHSLVHRGSPSQIEWWAKEWLPNFFQNAAESDLLGIYAAANWNLERVENLLQTAPEGLYYLYKANRQRFASQLFYAMLPQELYNRLLTLLAVREAMIKKESLDNCQLARAIANCQEYFWGNSAYAVAFCVCRDAFGWQDNASNFERLMQDQGLNCPTGTIASTFYNNKYMKLHIDKWKASGASDRVLKLVGQLKSTMKKGDKDIKP